MPPIKNILYDCDNTLVLSESAAFEGCAELANEILAKYSISKRYTGPELLSSFVGQNFNGMLKGLMARHDFTMPPDEMQAYISLELEKVIQKLNEKAAPCVGVMEHLEQYKKEGKYGMAIVSSSAMPRVVASIKATYMDHYFQPQYILSAASSLDPPTSKPDPAIYLHACKVLGTQPGECVAVEDSRSGATAAKNAKIPLIGYVGPYEEEGEEKVKSVAKMLTEECGAITIMYHWQEFDQCLKKVIQS